QPEPGFTRRSGFVIPNIPNREFAIFRPRLKIVQTGITNPHVTYFRIINPEEQNVFNFHILNPEEQRSGEHRDCFKTKSPLSLIAKVRRAALSKRVSGLFS
ncbi:MAG: hypothetical protein ACO1OQ_06190, partial [Rufibacter sp.]